jgi:cobyrinic acid a,c-diamide synthase
MGIPRIIIAGTGSGVGKTSLSLALVRALTRRGLRVQTFKVGPDFLDPTHLARASGRTCYNLDSWMCGREYVEQLFQRVTAGADIAVIEGVMGLFDGASPDTSSGSTAEIARWLHAPVLLVVDAKGTARSIGAVIKGFDTFEPDLRIAGVIANRVGSARHAEWLAETVSSARLPPLVGCIPAKAFPSLPSRHLGLVTADAETLSPALLDSLADTLEKHVDLEKILALARTAPMIYADGSNDLKVDADPRAASGSSGSLPVTDRARRSRSTGRTSRPRPVTIGIASDAAFHFYYPDNLECLQAQGAQLVHFSPIRDSRLPAGLDALYLGGGYPEEYAADLARNGGMLESIRQFAAAGGAVYAECGGLMMLSQSIETLDGIIHPMAGLLPFRTRMCARRQSLGYTEVTLKGDTLWGPEGTRLRGHEFHYSEIVGDPTDADWKPAYQIQYRRDPKPVLAGAQRGRILAGYVHLHFASHPDAVRTFLDFARKGLPA